MSIRKVKQKPNKQVIKINNYIRYWDKSVDNGHDFSVVMTDGSVLEIEMRWPKGEDRFNKPGRAHGNVAKNVYK